jgi:hypothetical protein
MFVILHTFERHNDGRNLPLAGNFKSNAATEADDDDEFRTETKGLDVQGTVVNTERNDQGSSNHA